MQVFLILQSLLHHQHVVVRPVVRLPRHHGATQHRPHPRRHLSPADLRDHSAQHHVAVSCKDMFLLGPLAKRFSILVRRQTIIHVLVLFATLEHNQDARCLRAVHKVTNDVVALSKRDFV